MIRNSVYDYFTLKNTITNTNVNHLIPTLKSEELCYIFEKFLQMHQLLSLDTIGKPHINIRKIQKFQKKYSQKFIKKNFNHKKHLELQKNSITKCR